MKKIVREVSVILSLVLFLSASSVFASASVKKEANSSSAPQFSLTTVSGKTVSLKDFKGKNVVLFFFTTWCLWCRKKFPALIKDQQQYKSDGVELVIIDVGESQAKVSSFIEKQGIPFDILLDRDTKVSEDYDVVGIPNFVLVSSEGNIVYSDNDMPNNYNKIFGK
jgi:peroxiredoxin